jgi:L-seryl-tRNA(Ser) seleniumtransferase
MLSAYAEATRVEAARRTVDSLRRSILAGSPVDLKRAEQFAAEEAERLRRRSLRPAINLSGVALHTGLGRARLADSVAEHVRAVAESHAIVEFDEGSGKRGDRQDHVRDLICGLTGAEDAFVVNNAAAAVFLSLASLCGGREVILSRGQMVEIGGSFRMPDIVRQSGCKLVEVGCTNKTRLSDYAEAITDDTAAILRCHPSNFRIVGFTEEPTVDELATFARENGVLCIDDQGNGCLVDTSAYGLPREPTLIDSVRGGADVAIASGDKLLGGPQAGMIVGRREVLARIRKHPLARAVRIDKLCLAALEATLRLYVEDRVDEIPLHRYLGRPIEDVRGMAERLASSYRGGHVLQSGLTEVGGGALPGTGVETVRVGLEASDPEELARQLRAWDVPIVARIERDRVWLDPRTLDEDEVEIVQAALAEVSKA